MMQPAANMNDSPISPIEAILEDARNGKPYILVDAEDRENEGDIIIPAQFATPEAITFMLSVARGYMCLSLTEADCDRLRAEGLESFRLDYADEDSIAESVAETLRRTGGTFGGIGLTLNGPAALTTPTLRGREQSRVTLDAHVGHSVARKWSWRVGVYNIGDAPISVIGTKSVIGL
jgi:hypothetical protein